MKANEFLITIQHVMDFVGRLTRIFEVGIAFDARRPKDATNQEIPTSASSVAHIHVGGSRIDDVEYVGRLFASLPLMGGALMIPANYLPFTFLPTPEERDLWYRVNGEYLVDRKCECGTNHVSDTKASRVIEHPC